jgi:hypothetical protein
MASKGHRGQLLIAKSKAKATKLQQMSGPKAFHCFKCTFFSTNETFLDRHMTYFHLIGPNQKIAMEKFIAISNPNLLLSTFHSSSCEDSDAGSEISGVQELPEDVGDKEDEIEKETHETEAPPTEEHYFEMANIIDNDNVLNDGFMSTPGTSQINLVTQVLSGTRRRIRPSFSVNSVARSPPNPSISVNSGANSPHESIQRITSTGGIRATPKRQAQKRNQAGKDNLVAGGNRKVKDVKDIGEFKTKYKANEKTKNLITKHAKEASEHLLKLSNSKVDGMDEEENGFFMAFKAGGRTFIAREGVVGKKFVEDEAYRETLIEASKTIDIQLNNTLLTSMLKAQYGTTKKTNTPKSHKRKNYNGIGGQKLKKSYRLGGAEGTN